MNDDNTQETRRGFSRRRFVKAAGASGVGVTLAGCLGGGGGDNNSSGGGKSSSGNNSSANTKAQISTKPPKGDMTIQFASDKNFAGKQKQINSALHNAGLPDNINLKIIAGSFTTGDRQNKYQQLLSAGQQKPTLLMVDNGWTIPFIARDQLTNLSAALPNKVTKTVKNDYFETFASTAMQDGDLYGIPFFIGLATMQYRKDLLRKAGYSNSDFKKWATESMTWKKFSQVVKQGMDETGKQGFLFQGASYEGLACCDFVEFMSGWGGAYFGGLDNLFGPIGDRPVTVTKKPVVDSIRMIQTFINGQGGKQSLSGYKQISPQAVVQYKEESSRKPFTNGNAIALRNWPYAIQTNATKENFGKDLGVMPMPYATTQQKSSYDSVGGPTSALGGWHLAINPNSSDKQKAAAYQVLKAVMTKQFRLKLFNLLGSIPPEPKLLKSKEATKVDILGRYVDSLRVAGQNAVPRPVTVVWPQEASQIAKEVNAAYQGQKSAKKSMSDLQAALKQIEKKGA